MVYEILIKLQITVVVSFNDLGDIRLQNARSIYALFQFLIELSKLDVFKPYQYKSALRVSRNKLHDNLCC